MDGELRARFASTASADKVGIMLSLQRAENGSYTRELARELLLNISRSRPLTGLCDTQLRILSSRIPT